MTGAWGDLRDVERLERWAARGGFPRDVAVGLESDRDCGCRVMAGLDLARPDPDSRFRFEPTVCYQSCLEHGDQADAAMRALREIPPSDRLIVELMQELLDREIAGGRP